MFAEWPYEEGLFQLRSGDVILAYTIGYAMARFVLEFFRGDADRGFIFDGWLSTSQLIALVLIAVVIVMWAFRPGDPKRSD